MTTNNEREQHRSGQQPHAQPPKRDEDQGGKQKSQEGEKRSGEGETRREQSHGGSQHR